ncbi:MAG: histidinol dehydrogenase [Bacteroidota bacterium]
MKYSHFPQRKDWPALLARPVVAFAELESRVMPILDAVRQEGDEALKALTSRFDKVQLDQIRVSQAEIQQAESLLDPSLKQAIQQARQNILTFHQSQQASDDKIETMPGVLCWRKNIAIEKVGLYIPGGTAPLFSTVLMLAVPANIAGCEEIVLCTPPDSSGKVHPAILYTASLCGVTTMCKVGGAQAVAAMAYGTSSVPRVYKIFGPGNQYVTMAKQLVAKEGVAIDLPAGPSELAVVADDTAKPAFVAADLLSQAEHGIDSQVLLVSSSRQLIEQVQEELRLQLPQLPRADIAEKALANSQAILVEDEATAIELINAYAPEHLILAIERDEEVAARITNAGSVFLGNYTPESVGDYASGTNHTLPTNGYARSYSGVSLDSFVKKITFQKLTAEGLQRLGPTVEIMAEAEELIAHKRAVSLRLSALNEANL